MKKKLTLKEVQERELIILNYVHQLCIENDIHYALIGGALLGAHHLKGFIPADDDIDIGLLRPEYEKLIALLEGQSEFPLMALEMGNSPYLFAKLTDSETVQRSSHLELNGFGVYVDIFPFDILPDDVKEAENFKLQVRRNGAIKSSFKAKATSGKWWQVAVKTMRFSPEICYNRLVKGKMSERLLKVKELSSRYARTDGKSCAFIASKYGDRDTLPRENFQDFVDVEFEGKIYQTFAGYEDYLLRMYGEYNPNKSHQTHGYYHFYWRKKSK
ncbi:phosphorylcholine transferase LicD [Lactococcus nasutitermitis]|uniref:Phosphorylcholine transferase LicD n=1 Tax=Lactococcus nasutitermitis TaxID=1652957 RepID=A0ABV9JBR9_9LACT|nr:LicD family protein [Lactococcus nasutitermitis]